jgi:hypothetical protein
MTKKLIEQFIEDGFVRIDNAFTKELAAAGREILWKDTGCDPDNPTTWTKPVIRLGDYPQPPFREAANMPILYEAFDSLVGKGRWLPRYSLGTFPIRFPSPEEPGDTGWHAEASFAGDDGSWRLNVNSKGRSLLMLFLFSDIDEETAPTRILVGSHLDVPKMLQPAGENGLSFIELAQQFNADTLNRPMVHATGDAGTVYLCHPFLVHAGQLNHGTKPRFMAQPPLQPAEPLQLYRDDAAYSPVEIAIRRGLNR